MRRRSDVIVAGTCEPTLPVSGVILDEGDAMKRKLLLAELQAVLMASGVRCVVAGNHRLVLRYGLPGACSSGPTDPVLHLLAPPGAVTTDGASFRLRDGREFPVSDQAAVAAAIRARTRA